MSVFAYLWPIYHSLCLCVKWTEYHSCGLLVAGLSPSLPPSVSPSLSPSVSPSLRLPGYRLIKIVLFLIGFVIGSSLTYFTILSFSSDHFHMTWVPYTAATVSIVVGIICGVLTICIYYIGIFLAGASIGFLLTWFILAAIDIPFFREHIYVPVIGAAVGAVIVGGVSLWIQKWFFMLGTSVLGSFMICWGVDYFLELGTMVYYLLLFAEHRSRLEPCWYSWGMLPLFLACSVAAFLLQALLTGRKYDHRKELQGLSSQFIACCVKSCALREMLQ